MILPFLAVIVFVFALVLFIVGRSIGEVFCSPNDTIYQAFSHNIDNLKNAFPSVSSPTTKTTTSLIVPDQGREYVVRADYWSASDLLAPSLYIPLLEAGSSLLTGDKGYLYTSNLSAFWNDNYKLTKLNENIYCYSH